MEDSTINTPQKSGYIQKASIHYGEKSNSRKKDPTGAPNEIRTTLMRGDVLLGRGTGYNEYEGNKRFRRIVEEHREEYVTTENRQEKNTIAVRVLDEVQSSGGRFLRRPAGVRTSVAKSNDWIQVHRDIALEKCKQALRQQRGPTPSDSVRQHEYPTCESLQQQEKPTTPVAQQQTPSTVSIDQTLQRQQYPSISSIPPAMLPIVANSSTFVPSMNNAVGFVSPFIDTRLFLHQNTAILSLQQHHQLLLLQSILQHSTRSETTPNDPTHQSTGCDDKVQSDGFVSSTADGTSGARSHHGDDDALYALGALSIAGRPMITDEQRALEQAAMTDEERMSALADKFGKMCSDVLDRQQLKKRAKRDLDADSIDFLVRQMRLEIDRIPNDCKEALLEAKKKSSPRELSDARLLQFLRCEGMNVKLGAQRFVRYWSSRRSVFGRDKFCLRMTLCEAFRDDLPAIEEGVLLLLPHRDLSGRPILFYEPCRRSGNGYTSESLLRAFWYVMEVAAEQTIETQGGVVCLGWLKQSSVFDFPRQVYDRYLEFEKSCFPVRIVASHSCCPTSVFMKLMLPVFCALTDKKARSRVLVHDVAENQIFDALSPFGIRRYMLPTEMGGGIQFNQREWIAERRALELADREID